jgi:F-type H+-transporting ATPase subunit delta
MQLRKVDELFQSPKLKDAISSPVLSRKEKQMISAQLTGSLKLDSEVYGLIQLLAMKDRMAIYSDVVMAFEMISDEKNKVLRGTVTSASALSTSEREEVEAAISKSTGFQLLLDFKEDKDLVGGLIATVGSFTFDGTLNTQLLKLKEEINRRVN